MNEPVEIGSKPEISSFKKTLIYWHKTKLTLSWKKKLKKNVTSFFLRVASPWQQKIL